MRIGHPTLRSLRALPILSALLLLTAAAAADVLTVSPGGLQGADFGLIQDAVDAAAEGDIIRVSQGTYVAFEIDGKGLSVIADEFVTIVGELSVRNLGAGSTVVLQNLKNSQQPLEHGLVVKACVGEVIIDSCSFRTANFTGLRLHGGLIEGSNSVTISNSVFAGGHAENCDFCNLDAAGHGVLVKSSRVAFEDSSATGGFGGSPDDTGTGGNGAAGMAIVSSFVHAAGSHFVGGNGGIGGCGTSGCFDAGDGASAVVATGTSGNAATVRLRGSTLAPGQSPNGTAPPTSTDAFAALSFVNARAASLASNSPVRLGETLELRLTGQAADSALLAFSLDSSWVYLPQFEGVLRPSFPLLLNRLVPAGQFPAGTGEILVSLPINDLAGLDGVVLHAQLATTGSGGNLLGSTTVIVLLDDAF